MSSYNPPTFPFVATLLILGISLVLNAFTLTDHKYSSFLLDMSESPIGHEKSIEEIITNVLGIHKNNVVFASPETASSLSNGNLNVTLSPLSNSSAKIASRSNSLEYNARVLCGTIVGEDGPLRPGRYNSDINIFNRQNFPVSFFWKVVLSTDLKDEKQRQEEQNSNFILLALSPGNCTAIGDRVADLL